MARNQAALAPLELPPSRKRRSRGRRRNTAGAPARAAGADWTELELAFFAAAPPDDPQPAAEPESFDDLLASPGPAPERCRGLRRLVAAIRVALT